MPGVTIFQPSDLLTAWTASPLGLALLVLVAGPYAVCGAVPAAPQ